jgi:penicillin G amidase
MTLMQEKLDRTAALPRYDGTLMVAGSIATVTIRRDEHGVAHIRAEHEADAWFGMGYASAQDRLWQMEYDRLRAAGRLAEVAGPSVLAADLIARRLDLVRGAQDDLAKMSAATRAMFVAYAAGVNAFLNAGGPLPVEYALTGLAPEPWQPWHSSAIFKVRHVMMGVWQLKLAQARLLARVGPERYARLDGGVPAGSPVIVPPSGAVQALIEDAAAEVAAAAPTLGFLAEVEVGSNSWAVHGSRTTTGRPVTCNDSHRALDVPTVYWQAHVACPQFDVIGATFPGTPGFPHFGHNGRVAWNITHGMADAQDLYCEEFDAEGRCRTPDGWQPSEHRSETIGVRDAEPVTIEVWHTRHGPVVHGDPRSGHAISLRWTGFESDDGGFEPLRPMLRARGVRELFAAQRGWVDPVNNLVAADVAGNIGYLLRGSLPERGSTAARQFPVPGWTDEHEWTGRVPFAQLPQSINPAEGYIATANQQTTPENEPYVGRNFAMPARIERIREVLEAKDRLTPEEIAALQADRVSRPAQAWGRLFARVGPFAGEAERARSMLAGFDGDLQPERGDALLYGCFRQAVVEALFAPVLGAEGWAHLRAADVPTQTRLISAWLANVVCLLDTELRDAAPDGSGWQAFLPPVLARAWARATELGGPEPAQWRWSAQHGTAARHPLSAAFPRHAAELDPTRVPMGGDNDTICQAGVGWERFDVTGLSVYRQVVDLADVDHASFVVPGGVAGLPGTQHAEDQLQLWAHCQRIPMHYAETDVAAHAVHTLTLRPA